jgi:hypothetical protein
VAVIKNKRGLSKLEFYTNARQLRKDLTAHLLRNFGVRLKTSKNGKMALCRPGEVPEIDSDEETILGEFPEWAIAEFRRNIMQILRNLMLNITAGNSIYPSSMEDTKTPNATKLPDEYVRRVQQDELADRRRYQTAAIVNCQQLIQELQYFSDVFSCRYDTFYIDVSKILPFIDKLQFEIRLLRGWRKSTNDMAKKITKEGVINK